MLQPKTPDERILVDTPVPTSSLLITQQPNVTKDQLKVSYGQLHYKIDYDFSANKLDVTVVEGKNLPAMDRNGMSDPYVKVALLPEGKQRFETKIKRKSLNPHFDETFAFNIPFAELPSKTIHFTVFDFDRLSRDDQIGQLTVPLEQIDFGTTVDVWKHLEPPEENADSVRLVHPNNEVLPDISNIVPLRRQGM
ncbi:hypothetical protein AB6A40_005920 [Gnathostoma spinigerum]|uniref:C2 domain-containing protein n=1 Tax=Gnathostoma spinigerum TaxID=75299 RepID=A0ABD6EP52_9BILA